MSTQNEIRLRPVAVVIEQSTPYLRFATSLSSLVGAGLAAEDEQDAFNAADLAERVWEACGGYGSWKADMLAARRTLNQHGYRLHTLASA